jgi:ketosteroid isomerase-like protein
MRSAVLAAVVVASIAAPVAAQRDRGEVDRKAVEQVFHSYLQSVKDADVTLAGEVWSRSSDVLAVTPFGRFRGWESVRDNIYVNFLQKAFSERTLEPSNVVIQTAGDAAWLVFDWTFTAIAADDKPIETTGWESHVYRRTPAGWRIVALHYSVPPPR